YGSTDGGITFLPLHSATEGAYLGEVACRGRDEILLSSSKNLVYSSDRGLIFRELAGTVWTLGFGTPRSGAEIWAGGGFEVAGGDLTTGLIPRYPTSIETLPWSKINSLAISPTGEVWAGTGDGVRASTAGGRQWRAVSRNLFEGAVIIRVAVGYS